MISEIRKGKNGGDGDEKNPHNWDVIEGGKERKPKLQRGLDLNQLTREVIKGASEKYKELKATEAKVNSALMLHGLTPENCPYKEGDEPVIRNGRMFNITEYRPKNWNLEQVQAAVESVKPYVSNVRIDETHQSFLVATEIMRTQK